MNQVGDFWWDKKSKLGAIEVNGLWVGIDLVEIGWDDKNFRARMGYGVKMANDWNMSNRFYLIARTVKQLAEKIKKHQYKLV